MKIFVKYCKLIGYKIVWTIHNVLPHDYKKKDVGKTKWFFENVDFHFVHYETNLKKIQDLGLKVENVTLINHPIYDIYPNKIDRNNARKKLGIPLDKRVLLSFGQIRKYKGLDHFQKSLKILGEKYYGLVVGKSVDKKFTNLLRKNETTNFRIIEGFVPDDEIQIYMNACDVVVLPYNEISTSGATLLAYAFSKPVLGTRVGCMHEVVNDETGLLVKPKDPNSLVIGTKKIFSKNYIQMGKNGYEMAKKKFTWDKLTEQTANIYMKLLNHK
jgi:glycosyltransferase involved in cell wall biosynthesis